jgi:hypothetical protein
MSGNGLAAGGIGTMLFQGLAKIARASDKENLAGLHALRTIPGLVTTFYTYPQPTPERPIGRVAGHGADDLQIVHGRGNGDRRVTEIAHDGEFQVALAFALTTAPPIARDRDGPADKAGKLRMPVGQGSLFARATTG